MALTLKVNARDLTSYLRTQHDQGFDPADPGYSEPQFSGDPAFREGGAWAGDAVSNREITVPLFLKAASEDALHQLIRDINSDLAPGAEVEYRSRGASTSTFFRLERGRLDVQYELWIANANRIRATLHLWTAPFGDTATTRIVASFGPGQGTPLATSSLYHFPATGVLGDTDALANMEVRVGSRVASSGRLIAYGVHDSASFNPYLIPSGGRLDAQSSSIATAASGALASLMYAIPVSPTGASGVALRAYLTPPGGHTGRHRVLGIFRSGLDRPITLWARDRYGAPIGPTTAASQTDPAKWAVADLGEVNVQARASGQEPVPTQFVEVIAGGEASAIINASPALKTQGLVLVPLERAPGVMRTAGAAGPQLLYGDKFNRLEKNDQLKDKPNADQGGVWTKIGGHLAADYFRVNVIPVGRSGGEPAASDGASALFALASGAAVADVAVSARLNPIASAYASGAFWELWPKGTSDADGATAGVQVRLTFGPSQTLAVLTHNGSATALPNGVASVGNPASGLWTGQDHNLHIRTLGNLVDVWIGTAISGSPILSATHGNVAQVGWPLIRGKAGDLDTVNNAPFGAPRLEEVSWSSISGSAPDTSARAQFRFESVPEARAIQGNASVFVFDRAGDFRGLHPRLPAVGSPGASGPARVMVMSGDPDDFLGNDVLDVSVVARERFRFLR